MMTALQTLYRYYQYHQLPINSGGRVLCWDMTHVGLSVCWSVRFVHPSEWTDLYFKVGPKCANGYSGCSISCQLLAFAKCAFNQLSKSEMCSTLASFYS